MPSSFERRRQRLALRRQFAGAMDARPCSSLQYGLRPLFVCFGPLVVQERSVFLLAVVTNRRASRRAVHFLAADFLRCPSLPSDFLLCGVLLLY